jgi:hypothetical protein
LPVVKAVGEAFDALGNKIGRFAKKGGELFVSDGHSNEAGL